MYSATITKAEKLFVQSDGTELLQIDFDVLKDGQVIVSYSHGLPLATTTEEVQAYIKAFIENYEANAIRSAENAERDAALAQADKTIEDVVGLEIKN